MDNYRENNFEWNRWLNISVTFTQSKLPVGSAPILLIDSLKTLFFPYKLIFEFFFLPVFLLAIFWDLSARQCDWILVPCSGLPQLLSHTPQFGKTPLYHNLSELPLARCTSSGAESRCFQSWNNILKNDDLSLHKSSRYLYWYPTVPHSMNAGSALYGLRFCHRHSTFLVPIIFIGSTNEGADFVRITPPVFISGMNGSVRSSRKSLDWNLECSVKRSLKNRFSLEMVEGFHTFLRRIYRKSKFFF